jgi:hypothetical protein
MGERGVDFSYVRRVQAVYPRLVVLDILPDPSPAIADDATFPVYHTDALWDLRVIRRAVISLRATHFAGLLIRH